MAIGTPGAEEFRDIVLKHRNRHIAGGMARLMDLREEITTNDDLRLRPGVDATTKRHLIQLLQSADLMRRHVTFNPETLDLGDAIAKAIDPDAKVEVSSVPYGGDEIQMGSNGLYLLPWDFSGADPNIPLASTLVLSNMGMLLLSSVNMALVAWTRLESSKRGQFIYVNDSLRIYGYYQQILGCIEDIGGPENFVDFAQVRATDEPRGPVNAPNRRTETPGGTTQSI
jgi:hypothetical protein